MSVIPPFSIFYTETGHFVLFKSLPAASTHPVAQNNKKLKKKNSIKPEQNKKEKQTISMCTHQLFKLTSKQKVMMTN